MMLLQGGATFAILACCLQSCASSARYNMQSKLKYRKGKAMKVPFVKMQGLGNDFIFIEDFDNQIDVSAQAAQHLCDRHFSVGADGVVLVRSSENEDCAAYMHCINADGTLSELGGNGLRCFAKFLFDRGFVAQNAGEMKIDTPAGPKSVTYTVDEQGKFEAATVDMGEPVLENDGEVLHLGSAWGAFDFTSVSMGNNPHAVCCVDDWYSMFSDLFEDGRASSLDSFALNKVGEFFESHPSFPNKTNVEFVCAASDGLHMRVYERGCGETLGCGTGSCAALVAACERGLCGRESDVHLPGGTLHIQWRDDNHVLMTGSAQECYSGEVEL